MEEKVIGLFTGSLEKVFMDSQTLREENSNSMLSDEKFHFQLALKNVSGTVRKHVRVEAVGEAEKFISFRAVENVPGEIQALGQPDDYYERTSPGLFPDILAPIGDEGLVLSPGYWKSVWITADGKKVPSPGKYDVRIRVTEGDGVLIGEYTYALEVCPGKLEENDLLVTHWMHYDCIAAKHGVTLFSEKFYKIFAEYLTAYTEGGNTMLLTPLFTPPLDTEPGRERRTAQLVDVYITETGYRFDFSKLGKFIRFASRHGVKYFEFSHLFTQWGGEFCPKIMAEKSGKSVRIFGWEDRSDGENYRRFLDCFLPELMRYLRDHGYAERCYFHLTDEPDADHLEQYLRCRDAVKKHIGEARIMDALSDYAFYEKRAVDLPAVFIPQAEPFLSKGAEILLYYCCSPCDGYYSNRFLGMPSQRNRILGIQLYLTGVKGFLHWGFNFYNSGLSMFELDPYRDTNGGGFFPAGDSFLVYPRKDGVTKSVRYEVFADGIQDYRALKALERRKGREFVVNMLKDEGVTGLNVYPRSAEWHREFRRKINAAISEP